MVENDPRNAHALAWLNTIADQNADTTVWEDDFLLSVSAIVDAGRPLTEKQLDTLERIYSEKTR